MTTEKHYSITSICICGKSTTNDLTQDFNKALKQALNESERIYEAKLRKERKKIIETIKLQLTNNEGFINKRNLLNNLKEKSKLKG